MYKTNFKGLCFITQNHDFATSNFKFLDVEGFNNDENAYYKLLGTQENFTGQESITNFIGLNKK